MNKTTAKKIAYSGITFGEIKEMLKKAYTEGLATNRRSVVNKGMSKAKAFNILWEGHKNHEDTEKIRGAACLGAKNALWEFGECWEGWQPEKPGAKAKPRIHHEEPICPF